MRQQFDRCGLEGAEAELGAVNHQGYAFLLDFFLHENPHAGAATGTNRDENECRRISRFRVYCD